MIGIYSTSSSIATCLCFSFPPCLLVEGVLQDTSHSSTFSRCLCVARHLEQANVCDDKGSSDDNSGWSISSPAFPVSGMNREQVTERLCGPRREDRDVADVVKEEMQGLRS